MVVLAVDMMMKKKVMVMAKMVLMEGKVRIMAVINNSGNDSESDDGGGETKGR